MGFDVPAHGARNASEELSFFEKYQASIRNTAAMQRSDETCTAVFSF